MPTQVVEGDAAFRSGGGSGERFVVVNADDLGLHQGINEAIYRAHTEGIVTSASLVACGEAFEDALGISRACPSLGIGVHLTVVEERPFCFPTHVASLIDSDGCFPDSYRSLTWRLASGRIRRGDLEAEFEAQISRVVDSGITPTHIDSHQHVHLLPFAWPLTLSLAEKYRIPYVRVPRFDSLRRGGRGGLDVAVRVCFNFLAAARRSSLRSLHSADRTPLAHLSGHVGEDDLVGAFQGLNPGVAEIGVHPGARTQQLQTAYPDWGFDWDGELRALTSPRVRRAAEERGVRLVNYQQLHAGA